MERLPILYHSAPRATQVSSVHVCQSRKLFSFTSVLERSSVSSPAQLHGSSVSSLQQKPPPWHHGMEVTAAFFEPWGDPVIVFVKHATCSLQFEHTESCAEVQRLRNLCRCAVNQKDEEATVVQKGGYLMRKIIAGIVHISYLFSLIFSFSLHFEYASIYVLIFMFFFSFLYSSS